MGNLKQHLAQHEELWVPSLREPELGYQVTCLVFLTVRRLIINQLKPEADSSKQRVNTSKRLPLGGGLTLFSLFAPPLCAVLQVSAHTGAAWINTPGAGRALTQDTAHLSG